MKILAIGDVCGSIGCNALIRQLSTIKKENNIDFTIVNGENSADGNGISKSSAEMIFAAGADIITGGNHTFRRKEILDVLDENDFLLRPHNFLNKQNGKGFAIADLGYIKIAVINLIGSVWMEDNENPFNTADLLIEEIKKLGVGIIIVDFHAEATAEKKALAYYLDGKVSAVFGTHTHVQTSDEQILPNGTGYITDIGMTGPVNSILGVKPELSIKKIKDNETVRFVLADGECEIDGCIFEIDSKTFKTTGLKRVKKHHVENK